MGNCSDVLLTVYLGKKRERSFSRCQPRGAALAKIDDERKPLVCAVNLVIVNTRRVMPRLFSTLPFSSSLPFLSLFSRIYKETYPLEIRRSNTHNYTYIHKDAYDLRLPRSCSCSTFNPIHIYTLLSIHRSFYYTRAKNFELPTRVLHPIK